jgi:DNA repair protein RadC
VYELKVVRERRPGYGPARAIRTSAEVYAAFRARFDAADREEFLALFLDGKNRVQGFHVVSVGSLTASLVHPRLCVAKHKRGYVVAALMWRHACLPSADVVAVQGSAT